MFLLMSVPFDNMSVPFDNMSVPFDNTSVPFFFFFDEFLFDNTSSYLII